MKIEYFFPLPYLHFPSPNFCSYIFSSYIIYPYRFKYCSVFLVLQNLDSLSDVLPYEMRIWVLLFFPLPSPKFQQLYFYSYVVKINNICLLLCIYNQILYNLSICWFKNLDTCERQFHYWGPQQFLRFPDSVASLVEFTPRFCCFIAVWLWIIYLTSLCLDFLDSMFEMGIIIVLIVLFWALNS